MTATPDPKSRRTLEAELTRLRTDEQHGGNDAVQRLVHDLRVHQIELQLQNLELMEAREALETSRDLYAELYDFAPCGYLSLDHAGIVRRINLTGAGLLGEPRDRLIGTPLSHRVATGHRTALREHLRAARESQESVATELRMRGRHGRLIDVRCESRADEELGGCRMVLIDVTDYKAALNEAQHERRKVELTHQAWLEAFDAVHDAIFLHDAEGRVIRANRAYAELAGVPVETVAGKRYWKLFPRGAGPIAGCLEASGTGPGAEEIRREEHIEDAGRVFYTRAYPVHEEDGSYKYSVHILEDVTEARAAEQAREQQHELMARILETVPHAIFWKDRQLNYLGCNQRFARGAGLEHPEEIAGKSDLDLPWLPEEAELYRRLDRAVIDSGEAHLNLRETQRQHDGTLTHVLTSKVPLRNGAGEVIGLLGVFADITEQTRLEAQSQAQAEALRGALIQTIDAIALTVEKRDPYTAGHQRRVARLAAAIARRMDLEEERIEAIRLGATIHDIGKIQIPAEILNRPGRLNETEYALVKVHPSAGYEILRDIAFPWPIAEMVRQHHERLDGTGYPDGLKGEDILLEARILGVADVFEAISSHRPYRPALGQEAALLELAAGRGRRYDARVADVCKELCSGPAGFDFGEQP